MKSLKIFSLIIIFFTTITPSFAQEKAFLLCKYTQVSVSDTNKRKNPDNDVMGLEIGKMSSRFYSINFQDRMKEAEEWKKQNGNKLPDMKTMMKNAGKMGKPENIYKNLTANNVVVVDRIGIDMYSTIEENPVFDWKISTDTMRILDQVCQKATCQFRGRSYEAWFAQEINVSEGPWKFNGLPGLILKISDSKKDYIYTAISIEKIDYDITPKSAEAQEIKKDKFSKLYKEFKSDPFGYMSARSTENIAPAGMKIPKLNIPYNPIELTDK